MEVSKFKSQLFIAFGQVTAPRRHVQSTPAEQKRSISGTFQSLQKALRLAEGGPQKAVGNLRYAIVAMSHGCRRFKSQLSNVLAQGTEHLQLTQSMLARIRNSGVERLQKLRDALRPAESLLRKAARNSRDAVVVMSHNIWKSRSRLSTRFEQGRAHLRRTQNTLGILAKTVTEKRQRLREERHTRENELRALLASSLDAIVVTNDHRRLVAANSKALELFGVSGKNLGEFTIDVFLSYGQIPEFRAGSPRFTRRPEKHGKWKIRRLDGSLRFAECVFVRDFVPFRHLCRFYDVTPQERQAPICRTIQAGPRQEVNA